MKEATMKTILAVLAITAVTATATAASTGTTAWSKKDMVAAVKALHYPKAGAIKLTCSGTSAQLTLTTWSPVRCVALYRHHRRRVFYAEWKGGGGWICAGTTAAGCKLLRHGFVTNAIAEGSPVGAAYGASRGYMANVYNDPQPFHGQSACPVSTPPAYSFCYGIDAGTLEVVVTTKQVRTGYIVSATSEVLP